MDELFTLVFGGAIMFGTPVYLVLQVIAIATARSEGWRVAAMLPLLFSVPAAVWCLYALAQDSNLWPLTFILFAPLGCLYLIVMLALRAVTRATA